jgi:hypothetical protein
MEELRQQLDELFQELWKLLFFHRQLPRSLAMGTWPLVEEQFFVVLGLFRDAVSPRSEVERQSFALRLAFEAQRCRTIRATFKELADGEDVSHDVVQQQPEGTGECQEANDHDRGDRT